MAAHRIPYAATVSLAHPEDALRKLRYALDVRGFRFIHMLAPCPTGWKSEPSEGIELVRLAVRAGLFAVYEVFDGYRYEINIEPEMSSHALEAYLAGQGRFRNVGASLDGLRAGIDASWKMLRRRAGDYG